MNDRGEIIPEIAESWSFSDDHTVLTLTLHRGAKWHDGTPVTSEDVLFTFDAIAREDVPFPVSDPLKVNGAFVTWSAPDARTVVLTLPVPSAHVLPGLTGIGLLPKHLLENSLALATDPYNAAPVGCGPWRLESWEVGHRMMLVPFAEYHLGPPAAERLTLLYQPTREAVADLLSGNVDITFVTPTYQKLMADAPDIRLLTYPYVTPVTLSFNFKHPIMANDDFRLAMLTGIDKDALIAELDSPCIQRADHQYSTGGLLDRYNAPALLPVEFEPERARLMLDTAGFSVGSDGVRQAPDGSLLRLRLVTYAEVPEYGAAVEILSRQLREHLQIEALPAVIPFAELAAHWSDDDADPAERPWMVSEYPLPLEVDPDVWGSLHSRAFPPIGHNVNFVSFPELARLIELSRETIDPVGRLEVFYELDRRRRAIRPALPLFQVTDAWAFRSAVVGYSPDTPNSRWLIRSANRFLSTIRT
jgi:peptide/nickel transport system substrate-binding protein